MATETTIKDWLNKEGWNQYVAGFKDLGLATVEDLGPDPKNAMARISQVVPDTNDDLREKVFESWEALVASDGSNTGAGGHETPTPPAIPELKPGTRLDLSAPIVELPNEPPFKIPEELRLYAAGGKAVAASSLNNAEWMVLAKRRSILHGVRMDLALAGQPRRSCIATQAVLAWLVPSDDNWLQEPSGMNADTSLDLNEQASNARKQTIIDASVSGQYQFCSASFNIARDSQSAAGQATRTLYLTGTWLYPRATLILRDQYRDYCAVVNDAFVAAVIRALAGADQTAKFTALKAVFEQYGHVVATKVTLGGAVQFQSQTVSSATVNEQEVRDTIAAAAALKVGQKTAGGSASFQTGTGTSETATQLAASSHGETIGVGALPGSLDDPDCWDVIELDNVVSVIDLLPTSPRDLQQEVKDAWDAGMAGLWGGHSAPTGYAEPIFCGQQVYIAQPSSVTGRTAIAAYPDPEVRVYAPEYGDDVPLPYPLRAAGTLLPDPAGNKLLFTIQYSGRAAPNNGIPLYWIITADGNYALSCGFNPVSGYNIAVFDSAAAVKADPHPENNRAAWMITKADPGGAYGPDFKDTYLLTTWVGRHNVASDMDDSHTALYTNVVPTKETISKYAWEIVGKEKWPT